MAARVCYTDEQKALLAYERLDQYRDYMYYEVVVRKNTDRYEETCFAIMDALGAISLWKVGVDVMAFVGHGTNVGYTDDPDTSAVRATSVRIIDKGYREVAAYINSVAGSIVMNSVFAQYFLEGRAAKEVYENYAAYRRAYPIIYLRDDLVSSADAWAKTHPFKPISYIP